MNDLLSIDGVRTHFDTDRGVVKAVDGIDLTVESGETVGLVGESGSGRSVTALSTMDLIENVSAWANTDDVETVRQAQRTYEGGERESMSLATRAVHTRQTAPGGDRRHRRTRGLGTVLPRDRAGVTWLCGPCRSDVAPDGSQTGRSPVSSRRASGRGRRTP